MGLRNPRCRFDSYREHMLFTGKGDSGTTKLFNCDQRLLKNAPAIEALGALDELNSWLGVCCSEAPIDFATQIREVQQNLFIIQAELAGAPGKTIDENKVRLMGEKIGEIERELPPIKSFFLPGGVSLAAKFDYARTVARRAERRCVGQSIGAQSLAYLNRLSSLFYALARLANHKSGIKEESPRYE